MAKSSKYIFRNKSSQYILICYISLFSYVAKTLDYKIISNRLKLKLILQSRDDICLTYRYYSTLPLTILWSGDQQQRIYSVLEKIAFDIKYYVAEINIVDLFIILKLFKLRKNVCSNYKVEKRNCNYYFGHYYRLLFLSWALNEFIFVILKKNT